MSPRAPRCVAPANAPGHDRRENESKIGSMSPSRLADRADRADRQTGQPERRRGRFLTCWIGELVEACGPRRCYQVFPACPASQQTLGRRQCSVQTCISTTAWCPDPCVHRSCPWLVVMRLNPGDCTPEAQSAQHREWLPACCSWPSGCEEGAVSLVRIGEEQFGTHHLDTWARTSARPQGGETGLAQVPAAQRAAEAVQSARPAHL